MTPAPARRLAAAGELDRRCGHGGVRARRAEPIGRRLGVLVLDDRPVTETMVEAGWALALWSGENEALSDLMIEAADDRRGMWGSACGRAGYRPTS